MSNGRKLISLRQEKEARNVRKVKLLVHSWIEKACSLGSKVINHPVVHTPIKLCSRGGMKDWKIRTFYCTSNWRHIYKRRELFSVSDRELMRLRNPFSSIFRLIEDEDAEDEIKREINAAERRKNVKSGSMKSFGLIDTQNIRVFNQNFPVWLDFLSVI